MRRSLWIVGDQAAISEDASRIVELTLADVRSEMSAPLASLALAAAGLAIAAWLLARRHSARRALAHLAAGVSGIAEATGWVTFDDARGSIRLDATSDDEALSGPVVVISGEASARGAYRGEGQGDPVAAALRGLVF